MPNYENYQHLVNNFNEKYGVNFSYEEFEAEVNALRNSRGAGVGSEIENEVYVSTYKNLFKKAVDNLVHARLAIYRIDHDSISADYEKMMNGYIDAHANEDDFSQTKWIPTSQLAGSVSDVVASYPDTNTDYIAQKYLGGEFRIRDMRARTNLLESRKETNPERICAILCYAEALEKVNSQRSFWWRVFHPFRNSAEKSEAKNMRKFVNAVAKEYDRINRKEGLFLRDMQNTVGINPTAELRDRFEYVVSKMQNEEEIAAIEQSLKNNPILSIKENPANNVNVSDNAKEPVKENNLNLGNESKRENIGEHVKEDIKEEVNNKQPKNEKPTAMQKFNEVTERDGFMNEFTKEVAAIISRYASSPNTQTIKEYLCDFLFNWTKDLCESHDDAVSKQTRESEIGREMGTTVNALYTGVLTGMDMYGVSVENRPIVAQLVMDHALKKLSPAGFFPEKYGKYANRYTIETNSNAVVQEIQESSYTLTRQDCVRICDNAKEQLREMDRISKATNENVDKDEEIQNERIEDRKIESSMTK